MHAQKFNFSFNPPKWATTYIFRRKFSDKKISDRQESRERARGNFNLLTFPLIGFMTPGGLTVLTLGSAPNFLFISSLASCYVVWSWKTFLGHCLCTVYAKTDAGHIDGRMPILNSPGLAAAATRCDRRETVRPWFY